MKNLGFIISLTIFVSIYFLLKQCTRVNEKENNFRGILMEVFIDESNRSEYTYKLQTDEGNIYLTVKSYPESYNYTEIGDSIIKEKGDMKITIKKKSSNYSTSASFSYK